MADENTLDAQALLKNIGLRHRTGNVSFDAQAFHYLNLSFSISGEDLILRKKVRNKMLSGETGNYVDVGALHPFDSSNTYLFYLFGWRGVCIDSNPKSAAWFSTWRPKDKYIHAAISQKPRDMYFAEHKNNMGMSRVFEVDEKIAEGFGPPEKVSATRLDTILASSFQSGQVIDIMSVDVERMELDVLKSNDWGRYRPRHLCIEEHAAQVMDPNESLMVKYMIDQGYKVSAVAPPNIFFSDTAHHPIP